MRQIPRPSPSVLCLLLLALFVFPSILVVNVARSSAASRAEKTSHKADASARARQTYGQLPLSFEPNRGQADARVRFLAHNGAYRVYLADDEIALALRDASKPADFVRIKLLGANREPRAEGLEELEGKTNYLVGQDPSRWRTNVPNYGKVKYEGVYPGVDLVFYGTRRQLEYDFRLAAGADPRLIRLRVEGAKKIRVDENGDLVLPTAAGEVRQHAPRAFQEVEGERRTVECRYVRTGTDRVGFELGEYDRSLPLVIDPVLSYSTYLGGGGYDSVNSVGVDAMGNAYVVGQTSSWDFPVSAGAFQGQRTGAPRQETYDAFVTKLNPEGTAVVYSTYLGGYQDDRATSVAVDDAGNAYVAGYTDSSGFPTTPGAYRTTSAGASDLFVTKLDPGGAPAYSTYLGGSYTEFNPQVALGGGGELYVGGRTYSLDYPVTPGAFQPVSHASSLNGSDGFVTKLDANGSALLFSTYLGGGGDDFVEGLARGLDNSVYVTGRTTSTDFPVTPGALQGSHAPGDPSDAFVTRLSADGTSAIYSTYLGGTGIDVHTSVAVDSAGAAYVAGLTYSDGLPTTPGAFQPNRAAGGPVLAPDAFVAKLSPDGAAFQYLTYFGGKGAEDVLGITVDAAGNAYVAGQTGSADLPVRGEAMQNSIGGGMDGYFFVLNETGTSVPYSTYVGGSGQFDTLCDVAVDRYGGVYLVGTTYSTDLPVTPGAFQQTGAANGKSDGFVMKLDFGPPVYTVSGRVTNQSGSGVSDAQVNVNGTYSALTFTDADGNYVFDGLPRGANVTVSASRYGFTFTPAAATLTDLARNETVNFSGSGPLTIQGQIADDRGNGVYVPVTITSADGSYNMTAIPYYEGRYNFIVPAGGTYTVTPGPDPNGEFTFAPPSRTVENIQSDQTFDFVAQHPPRLFGRIADGNSYYGSGLAGVRVTLTSPALASPVVQTTDSGGYFFFETLERGATYTVTPSDLETNRTFTPTQQTVENIQGFEFMEFTALPPLSIHGRVADANSNAVTATATLTGAVNAVVETDQWGYFSFMNLPRGADYTVKINKPGSLYTFAPPSQSVTNLQDLQFLNFEALPPLRIHGFIADANFQGLPATVTLTGTVNATTQADQWGTFLFDQLPRGGDYTVTVSYPLYTFEPPSQSVTNIQSDQFFRFEALPPLRIDGGVRDENGVGVAGVLVTLSGAQSRTATTDEWGTYRFEQLPRGGDYVVTPAHDLYNFTPASRALPALNADQFVFFDAALRRFTLRGRAALADGSPLANVNVILGGASQGVRTTDANGEYAFANLPVGRSYTVTAAREGYAFAPATHNVNDPRGDQTANFTGSHLTYTLSGRLTDTAGGAGLSGVSVTLGGSSTASAQTDAQGNYAFAGLPSEGNYTVGVSHPHFGFEPASRTFNNLLGDASGDFNGTRLNRRISGRVTDGSGAGLSGATVTLGGARNATTQTDVDGSYLFDSLPSGFNYSVTVSKTHYAFNPTSRQFAQLGADATADFNATLFRHNITGRVVDANGKGFAGALVQLIGEPGGSVTTDGTGNFIFNNLPAGANYTVEPSRQFYDFSPVRGIFNDLGADQTVTFMATLRTFSVGGRITEGANGVAGVVVSLSGTRTATTQTDAVGNYVFNGLPANGNYTVTPAADAVYTFSPAGATFNTLPFNQTANFSATRRLYQISGGVLDACRPIPGVTLALTHDGVTVTAQTNAVGAYTFANVQAGYNYTLTPTGSTYIFTPPSYAFPALGANQTGNFVGRPPAATTDVSALADLYVRGGNNAGLFFGTSTQLITRFASQAKDTYESYLKFNVGNLCTVASVKLRLYGQLSASGTLPVSVYGVPVTTWPETSTNWNNKPAAGALLSTVNVPGTTAAWYEWDVTDYVRSELAAGRTTVAFALKSTTTTNYQVTFNSREATGANAPRLSVTTP